MQKFISKNLEKQSGFLRETQQKLLNAINNKIAFLNRVFSLSYKEIFIEQKMSSYQQISDYIIKQLNNPNDPNSPVFIHPSLNVVAFTEELNNDIFQYKIINGIYEKLLKLDESIHEISEENQTINITQIKF